MYSMYMCIIGRQTSVDFTPVWLSLPPEFSQHLHCHWEQGSRRMEEHEEHAFALGILCLGEY